jgi:hypothetical protein
MAIAALHRILSQRRSSRRRFLPATVAAALAILATTAGCDRSGVDGGSHTRRGSGNARTVTRELAPFTAVDLAGTNNVTVHVGGAQSVVVRADDNLLELVTTDVRDGVLVIGDTGSFRAATPMSVTIAVPRLGAIILSGDGALAADGTRGAAMVVRLSGTGQLRVTGTTGRLDATLSGTGDEDLAGLSARIATAEVGGTGRIAVRVSGSLTGTVRGTGSIEYYGNPPSVIKSVTGTGSINHVQ